MIKPIHPIKNVSSLLRALRLFPYVKSVTIEIDNRNFILRVKLPWYYIFPYSLYKRFQIKMALNKIKEPGSKIKIR